MRILNLVAVAALAGSAIVSSAQAADLRSFAYAYAGDRATLHSFALDGSASNQSFSGPSHAQIATYYSFFGTNDQNGDPVQMDWTVTSSATAGLGVLKAGVTSNLYGFSDGFYLTRDCSAACTPTLSGLPEALQIQAQSSFDDDLNVVGAGDLSFVQFGFHIDGTRVTSPSLSSALIVFGGSLTDAYFADQGYSSVNLLTAFLPVIDGKVHLNLTMDASIDHDLANYLGNLDDQGTVDFLNTLTLTQATGYDVNKAPVYLQSVTGGGEGPAYSIAVPVPEPGAWAMLLIGFAGIGTVLRRRSAATLASV